MIRIKIYQATIILSCLLTGMSACDQTRKMVSKAELAGYISNPDNGLIQKQEVNGTTVEVKYQPSSFLVLQSFATDSSFSQQQKDSLEKRYNENYYFLLKFSRNGQEAIRQLGDFSRYSEMVQVLSFQMQRFVNLTTSEKDTVDLKDYLFDQTYGLSDGNTVLLCFGKDQLKEKKNIDVNIAECGFKTGMLKFKFNKSDIDKLPVLDYQKR